MSRTRARLLPDRPTRSGRTAGGQFAKGNRYANSDCAGVVRKLRAVLLGAVKEADVRAVLRALLKLAKTGDVAASKLVLSYACGLPESLDLQAKLDELEALVYEQTKGGVR